MNGKISGRDVTIHAYDYVLVVARGYSKVYVYSLNVEVIQSDYEEEYEYEKAIANNEKNLYNVIVPKGVTLTGCCFN